jgi:MFS family permease
VLAQRYGWRWAFYGFGATGVVVSLLLLLRLREPCRVSLDRHSTTKSPSIAPLGFLETLRILLSKPGVLLLMLAFACANGVGSIFLIWAPTFLFEKFHLGLVAAGFSAVAAIQLASAFGAPFSGILADHLSLSLRGARMLVQASGLVIGTLCVVAVAVAPTMGMLMIAMACFGLCKGVYDGGIFASVFEFVEPGQRASVVGLMNLLGWGGGALGPLAVGILSTYGSGTPMERMSSAIAWSGLAYLVAAGLIMGSFWIYRRMPHFSAISTGVEERCSIEER